MQLETERQVIKDYIAMYIKDFRHYPCFGAVAALNPETVTQAELAAVAGIQGSGVGPNACYECGEKSWRIVRLGDEPDYDCNTVYMCRACLVKAIALIDEAAP